MSITVCILSRMIRAQERYVFTVLSDLFREVSQFLMNFTVYVALRTQPCPYPYSILLAVIFENIRRQPTTRDQLAITGPRTIALYVRSSAGHKRPRRRRPLRSADGHFRPKSVSRTDAGDGHKRTLEGGVEAQKDINDPHSMAKCRAYQK